MSPFLIQLSIYVSNIFSPQFITLLLVFFILLSLLYLNIKRIEYKEIFSVNCPNNIKGIVLISISIIIAVLSSQILKFIFKIPRPENMLVLESGYSFPSGHATVAFSIAMTSIFLLFKYFKSYRFYINYLHTILFISVATLVSFSRLILQVHRPIDIIFGSMLGLLSSYLSIKLYYNTIKYVDKKIYK